MTTFPQPLFLNAEETSQLKSALPEPLFVTAVVLFWLIALPIGAVFSASVAVYDKMASLNSQALRLPHLRKDTANNPLVLQRKNSAIRDENPRAESHRQIVRA